jgi:hypothetical protein
MKQAYFLPVLLLAGIGLYEATHSATSAKSSNTFSSPPSQFLVPAQDTIKPAQDTTKMEYVREEDTKKKKARKAPAAKTSRVVMARDVQRASLSRRSEEGRSIDIVVMQSGVAIRKIEEMNLAGNSGNHLTADQSIGFENVNFPFEGSIRFRASNKMGTVNLDREVRFVITEPGQWTLRIDL